ncbi:bZIP transcription factor 12-like isoform X3 [Dioscorea cayenensis subsp. rotundata]|uniref:BZIP transcription factor 12-like isoform X3 n=1 Tax=Dioscorea cayennensis subsp. rotundata TaxID=55577 RepID=A0AB40D0E3_DIOCR|nr:bZIP transcription factor 12-like isoform X3 [Dioscorea cayenensis subsp. rotundata]
MMVEGRTVEEMWREMPGGRRRENGEMMLKDFLALAGAVRKEDVRTVTGSVFGLDPIGLGIENQVLGFGNGVKEGGDLGRVAKGRKRSAMDLVDRVALQWQKRMIKSQESGVRSKERKQPGGLLTSGGRWQAFFYHHLNSYCACRGGVNC